MAEYTNVRIAIEDRVAVLTIDHPPANAFNHATIADLGAAMDELIANDQVKVIVITGAGEFAFVAGADINEINQVKDGAEARAFITLGQGGLQQDRELPQAGHRGHQRSGAGRRVGAGDGLPHPHHGRPRRVWASRRANLGIIPGWGGTQRLARLVGPAKAIELILTGDMINAQEAFRLGLANKVVPAGQVLAEAKGLAKKIAAKSKLTNEAARQGGDRRAEGVADRRPRCGSRPVLGKLIGSHDTTEGVSAFLQKRQPKFTDS